MNNFIAHEILKSEPSDRRTCTQIQVTEVKRGNNLNSGK